MSQIVWEEMVPNLIDYDKESSQEIQIRPTVTRNAKLKYGPCIKEIQQWVVQKQNFKGNIATKLINNKRLQEPCITM